MQIDQRLLQSLQVQNTSLRQQSAKLVSAMKILQQKYQKSLKEMSSIIHANQNLKKQLDNLKDNVKNQIENSVKEIKINYEKKIQLLIKDKNQINIQYQNISRQKQQNIRNFNNMEQQLWEYENLKKQLISVKKQNQKLVLKTNAFSQTNNNNEQKIGEQKLNEKIQQLNNKIMELNFQNTQNRKTIEATQNQRQRLQKEADKLKNKNDQLALSLQKVTVQNLVQEGEQSHKAFQTKSYQVQIMDLRKRNAQLVNAIERVRLQKMEITSEVNKNEAEINLLNTLRSLHSQLQPMRYQIQQLKRDKYFERQNTAKQKSDIQMKLLSCEHELESLKRYIKQLQNKNRDLNQEYKEKQWQKYKVQELEQQKHILQGRVIVYEAMEMVNKNRDKPHHVERIKQFERRIHLLLEQQNLQYLVNNANVHQLIALKAYVMELDNKLHVVIEQNEHLNKKYANFKDKYQQLASENKKIINKHYSMVNAYKGKIQGYEKLIIKLTQQLQRYIKENQGSNIESQYKSVITLYQSKIMSITNQINAKKQENRQIQKRLQGIEQEMRGKLDIIKQLQIQLSNTKKENKDLNVKLLTQQHEQMHKLTLDNKNYNDQYKTIINDKTKQIVELEEQLSKLRLKLDKLSYDHNQQIENYKYKISRLEIEIEQLRLQQTEQNKQQFINIKNQENVGEIVDKINLLEKNFGNNNRNTEYLQEPTVFIKEINHLKNDVGKITLLLQNRISDLQTQLARKTSQLSSSQPTQKTIYGYQSQSPTKLQSQNKRLKIQLQKLKETYLATTQQSQRLIYKIKVAQADISRLKDDFNAVTMKMIQYEKKLSSKDNQIYQQKQRLNTLVEQYQNQLRIVKSKISQPVSVEQHQKQRYSNQTQDKVQMVKRQVDFKRRQIERRQLQTSRKQSQINSRHQQFLDKLRKLEERERIIAQEQSKLIRKSDDNWNGPNLVNSYSQGFKNNKQEMIKLQTKIKKIEQQLEDANKTIQIKDQKISIILNQKIQLSRQLEDLTFQFSGKTRFQQHNQRQIVNLKQEIQNLQKQLQKLWRQHQSIKQQLRNKQRQLEDANLNINQLERKHEMEIKQFNMRISQKMLQIEGLENLQNSPKKKIDYDEIQREWEERVRGIEERNLIKIKQLYSSNEENVRELQNIISDLNVELNKCKILGTNQSKRQIQAQTATIQSLQAHIGSLQRQMQRRQFNSEQIEEEANYYKGLVDKRDQQIIKIHQSPSMSLTSNQNKLEEKIRMQKQINSSQNMMEDRVDSATIHDQCIKKEHLLRMEIERLSGIVQAKMSIGSQKQGRLFDSSYLNELEQTNKQLQQDLAMERRRLLVSFEMQRNIDEYLAILVITFAQVDALRQRVYQLETNFKEEQERQTTAFKKLDNLQQHELDIDKILGILKELQESHRAFHEQEETSRSIFVRRISGDVLTGSQSKVNQSLLKSENISQEIENGNADPYQSKIIDNLSLRKSKIIEDQSRQVQSNYIPADNFISTESNLMMYTPYKKQGSMVSNFNFKKNGIKGSKNGQFRQQQQQRMNAQTEQNQQSLVEGSLDSPVRGSASKRLQFNQTQTSYFLNKELGLSESLPLGNSSVMANNR